MLFQAGTQGQVWVKKATDEERANFIIQQYTKVDNFYKPLNIALRTFKKSEELAYLRLPIKEMYKAIKYYYKQMPIPEQPTQYCYRGCSISCKQLEQLENNLNEYVQLLGFISTSKCESSTKYFKYNGKNERRLQLNIKMPTNWEACDCPGFADITQISDFKNQEEVLLNSKNIYRVVQVTHEYEHELVELEFINNFQPNESPSQNKRTRQLQLFLQKQQIEQKRVLEQGAIFKEVGPISRYTFYYEILMYKKAEECSDRQLIISSLKGVQQNWNKLSKDEEVEKSYLANLNEPELIDSIYEYATAIFIEKQLLLALNLVKIYITNVNKFKRLNPNSEQMVLARSLMAKCKILGYQFQDKLDDDIRVINTWLDYNRNKIDHECEINLTKVLLLYELRVRKDRDEALQLQSRLIKILDKQFLNTTQKMEIKMMLAEYYQKMEKNLIQQRSELDCIIEYYQLIQGSSNINIASIYLDYAINCNRTADFELGSQYLNKCKSIIEQLDVKQKTSYYISLQTILSTNWLGLGDVDSAKQSIETYRTTFMPDQILPNRLQYSLIVCPILQVTGEYEQMIKEQMTQEQKVQKKNLPEIFYLRATNLKHKQFIFYSSYFMAAYKYYVSRDAQWKQYLEESFKYGKQVLRLFEGRLNHYYTSFFCWGIRLQIDSGNMEGAEKKLEYLKGIIENNDIYMVECIRPLVSQEEGVIQLKNNNFQEAIKHLQQSLNRLQQWQSQHYLRAEILLHLGQAELNAGKRNQAQLHAKQCLAIRSKVFKNIKNGKKIKQAQQLLERTQNCIEGF